MQINESLPRVFELLLLRPSVGNRIFSRLIDGFVERIQRDCFKVAKTVRYLELTPTIEAILRERQNLAACGDFVFSRTGRSVTDYHQIMRRAAESAGVSYGKHTRGDFVTHDARHTAVTRMLQAGVDLSTVCAITGHSDSQLILHYSHATRESRKQAVSVLEDFVAGDKGITEDEQEPKKPVKKGKNSMRFY